MPICCAEAARCISTGAPLSVQLAISTRITQFFTGTGFVITPDAAVTVAVAGGATPPEVKERGWFPWAASLGQRWPSDALALGFLLRLFFRMENTTAEWPQMTQMGWICADQKKKVLIDLRKSALHLRDLRLLFFSQAALRRSRGASRVMRRNFTGCCMALKRLL